MGKKKQGLGRSIIKDRFGGPKRGKSGDSFLHTSELDDGFEWGRLNLQSVTEQSQLDEFLTTAELAGTEFIAEKMNVTFVNPEVGAGLLSSEELKRVQKLHEDNRELLCIPRRPKWDTNTSASELDKMERENFLDWRRGLSELQEDKDILMTPFEKNLDFWRQLWRVIERSDVVVQIVDARNPQLFRCEDLEKYVQEIDTDKVNLVLINKADLLTQSQREIWAKYYSDLGVRVGFWSAVAEIERIEALNSMNENDSDDNENENNSSSSDTDGEEIADEDENEKIAEENRTAEKEMSNNISDSVARSNVDSVQSETQEDVAGSHDACAMDATTNNAAVGTGDPADPSASVMETESLSTEAGKSKALLNQADLLNGEELLTLFKSLHPGKKVHDEVVVTIGMVGYPNVGKSSTINAILQAKKCPVSATPGRTKHFQTLFVEPSLMLCDCPGLVMPTFVSTKAEMVVNGILPIDQMRDHRPPVNLVCQRIPRQTLEVTYGVNIPKPKEGEDPARPPSSDELLNTYGYLRGYMTANGVPDCPRASRYILKDYVNGKLLYSHPPPGMQEDEFGSIPEVVPRQHVSTAKQSTSTSQPVTSYIDKDFFNQTAAQVHSKGTHGVAGFTRVDKFTQHYSQDTASGSSNTSHQKDSKPWKKHGNKNKKEKLRRIHTDLD